jgi:hypothetical protein
MTRLDYMLELIEGFLESVAIEIIIYLSSVLEDLEKFFRARRLSDHDIVVMSEKGYSFDLGKHRWVKWEEWPAAL